MRIIRTISQQNGAQGQWPAPATLVDQCATRTQSPRDGPSLELPTSWFGPAKLARMAKTFGTRFLLTLIGSTRFWTRLPTQPDVLQNHLQATLGTCRIIE